LFYIKTMTHYFSGKMIFRENDYPGNVFPGNIFPGKWLSGKRP